jgi:hypothetical protein
MTKKTPRLNILEGQPKLDTYRSEIANQVRRALEDPDALDNPITTYYPGFKVELP